MQNTKLNFEPVYVAAAAANLFNCAVTSMGGPVGLTLGQPYALLTHIRLTNSDTAARTVTLYKGATGASAGGTQFAFAGIVIPANSYVDWYSNGARFASTDFLTGVCDVASKVIITIEGEVGFLSA